jgi:hypothetical protein
MKRIWQAFVDFLLYDELFHFIAAVITIFLLMGLFLFSISCTKTVYRVRYVPQVVDGGCALPKLGTLPTPQFKNGCLDIEGMKQLAERNGRMVQWIREVKARCGPRPDAGVEHD